MDNQTGTNIDAITVLQNGNTTFSAESKFNDKVGINSGSKTLIVPLQVGPELIHRDLLVVHLLLY